MKRVRIVSEPVRARLGLPPASEGSTGLHTNSIAGILTPANRRDDSIAALEVCLDVPKSKPGTAVLQ